MERVKKKRVSQRYCFGARRENNSRFMATWSSDGGKCQKDGLVRSAEIETATSFMM
jgi:hypothetical protein